MVKKMGGKRDTEERKEWEGKRKDVIPAILDFQSSLQKLLGLPPVSLFFFHANPPSAIGMKILTRSDIE